VVGKTCFESVKDDKRRSYPFSFFFSFKAKRNKKKLKNNVRLGPLVWNKKL